MAIALAQMSKKGNRGSMAHITAYEKLIRRPATTSKSHLENVLANVFLHAFILLGIASLMLSTKVANVQAKIADILNTPTGEQTRKAIDAGVGEQELAMRYAWATRVRANWGFDCDLQRLMSWMETHKDDTDCLPGADRQNYDQLCLHIDSYFSRDLGRPPVTEATIRYFLCEVCRATELRRPAPVETETAVGAAFTSQIPSRSRLDDVNFEPGVPHPYVLAVLARQIRQDLEEVRQNLVCVQLRLAAEEVARVGNRIKGDEAESRKIRARVVEQVSAALYLLPESRQRLLSF
jgi:hypothetical protein